MRHLRVVSNEPDLDPYQQTLEDVARGYWRRVRKPGAPEFEDLPAEHQAELRKYVEPFTIDAVDAAVRVGIVRDREVDQW